LWGCPKWGVLVDDGGLENWWSPAHPMSLHTGWQRIGSWFCGVWQVRGAGLAAS